MDGASAIVAVLSLGIQLAETAQATSNFLRKVRNGPTELRRIVELLDQLQGALCLVNQISEQQTHLPKPPSSLVFVSSALQSCKICLEKLGTLVGKLQRSPQHQHPFQGIWIALKTAIRTEELRDHRNLLQETLAMLHLSVSVNSVQLQ